jgi:hypothetical protein
MKVRLMNTTAVSKTEPMAGSIVPAARLKEAQKLSMIARQSSRELIEYRDDPILQSVVLATAISELREALTPAIMSDFLKLANTPLGFRTDRGPGSASNKEHYPDAIVKDCLIQAMVRGVRPNGNEFNIIAGQCYVTKDGFRRLLRDFPGFSDFKIDLGVPKASGDGAIVHCSATWRIGGIPDSIECDIPVKGTGCDLLLGKAESKLYRRIYSRLTGSDLSDVASGEDGESTSAA